MTVTRVSTYGLHQQTLSNVMRHQTRMAELQRQQSSGLKAHTFQGLDGQVETFVQMEAKMRKTQTLIDNNNLIKSRLQTTDVVLDQLIDIADDYKNLLIQRRNPASAGMQFDVAARALLETAAGQLNTAQEGRYLFSGSRTDTPPVKEPVPDSLFPGIPDAFYYQGDDVDLHARVQENFELQYNVRANDPAIQQLFAAINLGMRADASDSTALLEEATVLISDALEGLIGVRAKVQQNLVSVEDINARHVQLNLYWKGLTETISKTDVLSVSTELAINEAIMTASFQSFTRLNQLRLTDYLR